MVEQSSMDAALARVGGWKRWHIAMYVLVSLSLNLPSCLQGINMVFEGWEPPHTCNVSKSSPHRLNIHDPLNSSQPLSDFEKWNVSNPDPRCYLLILNETAGNVTSEKCNAWSYDNDGYFTIVEKWDLVCDRNYMAEMSQSLSQLGSIIGGSLCFVVDIYGRKKIHIITHLIIGIFGLINACSVSYLMFVITRTLLGIFVAMNSTSGAMLVLEFFDSKRRTLAGILDHTVWTLFCIALPGLAYIIKNWSHLQIAISLASPLFALMVILVPESAAWLASRGRFEEADKVLRNIAKWNDIKLDLGENLFPEIADESATSRSRSSNVPVVNVSTIQDFTARHNTGITDEVYFTEDRKQVRKLANPLIIKLLAISCAFWFGIFLVYHGVMFSTPGMAGNRFMNFLILSLVELPSPPVANYLSKTVGRRLTSSISLLVTGCFLAVASGLHSISDSTKWLNLLLIICSKIFMTVTFAVMMLYTKEYFPTDIRATCYGICQIFGKVGSLLAPMTAYLIKANLKWLPNIIYSLTSLVVSLLILFLPETMDQPMPENMEDCRKLYDQKPIRNLCGDTFRKIGLRIRQRFSNILSFNSKFHINRF